MDPHIASHIWQRGTVIFGQLATYDKRALNIGQLTRTFTHRAYTHCPNVCPAHLTDRFDPLRSVTSTSFLSNRTRIIYVYIAVIARSPRNSINTVIICSARVGCKHFRSKIKHSQSTEPQQPHQTCLYSLNPSAIDTLRALATSRRGEASNPGLNWTHYFQQTMRCARIHFDNQSVAANWSYRIEHRHRHYSSRGKVGLCRIMRANRNWLTVY